MEEMVDAAVAAVAGAAIEAESQLIVNAIDRLITSGHTQVDGLFSFLEAAWESGDLEALEETLAEGHAEL